MAVLNVSPTRMELGKIKARLTAAVKGHRLLKDKRDELMRQFLELIKETRALRVQVEANLLEVNRAFALAGSVMQKEALAAALMTPRQNIAVQIGSKSIMGTYVPTFEPDNKSEPQKDTLSYGYAFTAGDLDRAILSLNELLPSLILLAQQEKTVQLLAAEIEKTRRRVNALKYVVIPNYQDTVCYIAMKLDESERSNLTRLMKVKDMMVQKQIDMRKSRM